MPTSLYLVDTSVWLEVLQARRDVSAMRRRVDELLAADQVATTGMIRLELLGGARTEADYRQLDSLLSALHPLAVAEGHWEQAAQLGFQLRRQGFTLPFTDLLIAAVAIAADVTVLHRDRHFDLVAHHAALAAESYLAH